MKWRLQQSKRKDFAERMIDDIYRKGVLVCRIHVAGDFYGSESSLLLARSSPAEAVENSLAKVLEILHAEGTPQD
jgi:hypothetical protein